MGEHGAFGFDPEEFDRVIREGSEGLRDVFERVSRFAAAPGGRAGWSTFFDDLSRRPRSGPETAGEAGDGVWAIYTVDAAGGAAPGSVARVNDVPGGPLARLGAKMFGGLPSEVAALAAVAFSVAVGFGVVAPAIPVFAHDFGVGRAEVGAVLSVFALMRLASAMGVGRLVDAIGERIILATGIAIVAVSSALAGFAHSYLQLLVLRGAGGIGSAMFSVSAMGLLLRVVSRSQRGRAVGLFQGGFLLGGISGPAIGGPLAAWSIRAPFLRR